MASFALITGAGGRIGKAFALGLAAMGYDIFLHYNTSVDKARDTKRLIEQKGRKCMLVQADFKKEEEVARIIPDSIKQGSIEILVNNASVFVASSLEKEGYTLLDDLYTTNFKAPYILTKQFSRHCKQGLIINLLDTKISQNITRHIDYLLTKKTLEAFTYIAAAQLAPHIRVNGIAPGLVLAPEGESEDYLQRLAEGIPLKQTGSPEQLNQALRFFVENEFVTGEVIHVDGGEHL